MNRGLAIAIVFACLEASVPQTALGQGRGSLELGFDLGVDIALSYERQFYDIYYDRRKDQRVSMDLPIPRFRIGFFLTDYVQIEPTFGLTFLAGDELEASSSSVGLVTNIGFRPLTTVSPFLQTGVLMKGMTLYRFSYNPVHENTLEYGIPIQIGLRLPIGERHALRLQSGGIFWWKYDQTYWSIPIQVGVSLFAF